MFHSFCHKLDEASRQVKQVQCIVSICPHSRLPIDHHSVTISIVPRQIPRYGMSCRMPRISGARTPPINVCHPSLWARTTEDPHSFCLVPAACRSILSFSVLPTSAWTLAFLHEHYGTASLDPQNVLHCSTRFKSVVIVPMGPVASSAYSIIPAGSQPDPR